MVETFFTKSEADQKLGRRVRAMSNLSSVPNGTEGTGVKVRRTGADDWTVRVEWQIPKKYSFIDVGEFSFLKRKKNVRSDFTKSEYEKLVQEIYQ